MEHYISLYIDKELSLNEKILFLEIIHADEDYKNDAVRLLEQEKVVAAALRQKAPKAGLVNSAKSGVFPSLRLCAAACGLFVLAFLAGAGAVYFPINAPVELTSSGLPRAAEHRFVLFLQDSTQVEITGSFTNWQKIPLTQIGSEGYWEIVMEVPSGEHRYSFIVDGTQLLPDPTAILQEPDDFGTINSILKMEEGA
jgi:hypothetical protein